MTAPALRQREPGLLGKRIRRLLRAVGLAKPHNAPATPNRRNLPSQAQARVTVTELYRTILKCEPDAHGRDTYALHLATGSMSQIDVVRALIESADFGTACSRHDNVAATLAAAVLSTLTRTTDDAAIRAYVTGLTGGMSVADFIREICGSPEFRAAWGAGAGSSVAATELRGAGLLSPGAASAAPGEIGQMIEGLIAARLIDEGAVLGLPPLNAVDRPTVSARQMMSLIRTLDMLADQPVR
jgi:hypothetical protein